MPRPAATLTVEPLPARTAGFLVVRPGPDRRDVPIRHPFIFSASAFDFLPLVISLLSAVHWNPMAPPFTWFSFFLLLLLTASPSTVSSFSPAASASPHSSSPLEPCHFDHHLLVVSNSSFFTLSSFFSSPNTSQLLNTRWLFNRQPLPFLKGFLFFPDGSYLEIWNSVELPLINNPNLTLASLGYQEGCRVTKAETVESICDNVYHMPASLNLPYIATCGRAGMAGDPSGGLFFIYQPRNLTSSPATGIRQVMKYIPQEKVKNATQDFELGGMIIDQVDEKILLVTDFHGIQRIIVASNESASDPEPKLGTPTGLISVQFTRSGFDLLDILIPKVSEDSEQFEVYLRPGMGIIVFDVRGYEEIRKETSQLAEPEETGLMGAEE